MLRTRRREAADRRLGAMGTDVHVVVVGGSLLVDLAERRIADLEDRWSRFRAHSEVSRLNAGSGEAVAVSEETRVLVRCAVAGWHRSRGWFDPAVHDAMVAAGYDRDFEAVRIDSTGRPPSPVPLPAGCNGIEVDDVTGTVRLPRGVRFDPGGIGKGLAADVIVAELLAAGAVGACVNVGGDLRVTGPAPDGPAWRVDVLAGAGQLQLVNGAVATSGTRRRRWVRGGVEQHHLIDPRLGTPARIGLREATVVAATGWEAEVAAKIAALAPAGELEGLLAELAVGAVIDDAGSTPRVVGDLEPFIGFPAPAARPA